MPVMDIARADVVSIEPEASLEAVVETMREHRVASVVVVDEDEPAGVITDRDLAMAVLDAEVDPETTPVARLLTGEPTTVDADAGIYDTVQQMSEHGARRLPVVADGDLVGIVSLSDVIVLLGMELQHVANTIRTVAPAYEQPATELFD